MPLIEYGAEIWAHNQECDLAELNKPYKEYFANIRPEKDSFIPFTPSQRMILLELLALFDYNKKDRIQYLTFFSIPHTRPKSHARSPRSSLDQKQQSQLIFCCCCIKGSVTGIPFLQLCKKGQNKNLNALLKKTFFKK